MTQIPYRHRVSSRARNLRLSLDRSGEVVVTTPKWCPQSMIEQFINDNQAWISHHQNQLKTKKDSVVSDTEVMIFGKKYAYHTQLLGESALPIGVHIQKKAEILTHVVSSLEHATASLDRFLKNTAEKYITTRVAQLAAQMKTTVEKLSFREQATRWGSCTSTGHLSFNWRLVHYPPPIIDYVIVHELAHRFEMNHSERFWRVVASVDPHHQERRRYLRRHGVSVG